MDRNTTLITQIPLSDLCPALRADMENISEEHFSAYEYIFMTEDGFVDGNKRIQIVWFEPFASGGVCFVGSGSDGSTSWYYGSNAVHVLEQHFGLV